MKPMFRRVAWPVVASVLVAAFATTVTLQWRHQETRRALERAASSTRIATGVRNQVATAFLLRSRLEAGDASVDTSRIAGAMQRATLLLTDWQQGRAGSRNVPAVIALADAPLRDAVGRLSGQVLRFDSLLRLPTSPSASVRLRAAYTDLSLLADSIDLLVARGSTDSQRRDDRRHRFSLAVLAATTLSMGLLFALLWMRWNATDAASARAQVALAESERRFRVLSEQLPVGVFRNARDGRLEYVNATLERIFGATADALQGNGWFDCVHPDDRARLSAERAAARGGSVDVAEFSFRIHRAGDGALREVILRGRFFRDASGEVESSIGIVEDVTERRALEAQLVQAQKMEAVGRLAGGVAHDFNNLLTVIGGITELILGDQQLPATLRQDVLEVHDASERARTLTRQLLALSRQQRIQLSSVPVAEVLTRTTGLLRRVLGEHISVSLELEKPGLLAAADAGAIEQMLLNLAVNARDAMPSGGTLRLAVTASDSGAELPLAGGHEGRWVVLSVEDTGSGISPDALPHIFEPFFTTKPVGQGTGLGLAMVQSLATQMRGAVTVQSTVGTGTTFRVYLPASAPTEAAAYRTSPGTRAIQARGVVLLVEDNAPLRRVAARALTEAHYTVLEAGDTTEARRQFEAVDGTVDVVVTDVVLPGESGPGLVRALRALRTDLPVLYITGFSTSEQLVQDVDAGTPMLAKPFDMHDLLATVDQLVPPRYDTPAAATAPSPPAATGSS